MFEEILAEFPPESETLEYKRKRANKESVVRELVAFANANGGRLIYGVQESDGEIEGFDDFSDDFQSYEEGISNLITNCVQPRISASIEKLEKEGKTLMGFSVESSQSLHTFREKKPYVPSRFGSTTDYLEGHAIAQFYRSKKESGKKQSNSEKEQWLRDLRKQTQRILFHYDDKDFSENSERVVFSDIVDETVDEVVGLLEAPPSAIEGQTIETSKSLIDEGKSLSETTDRVSFASVGTSGSGRSRRAEEKDKIERKHRQSAEDVAEKAKEVICHIEEMNSD